MGCLEPTENIRKKSDGHNYGNEPHHELGLLVVLFIALSPSVLLLLHECIIPSPTPHTTPKGANFEIRHKSLLHKGLRRSGHAPVVISPLLTRGYDHNFIVGRLASSPQ